MALDSYGSWRRAGAGNRVEFWINRMRGLGTGASNTTNMRVAGKLFIVDQQESSLSTLTIRYFPPVRKWLNLGTSIPRS